MPQRDNGSDSPHAQGPTALKGRGRGARDSGSDSLHAQGPTALKEGRRDVSPRQINNEGPRIRRSECGRILQ